MVLSTSLQSKSLHFRLCLFLLACLVGVRNHQEVDAANVFVWTPSISLSANFGVAEGLCPDIRGYGAGLNCDSFLQLHTCKSQGEDTQFAFDFLTNEIRSVNYDSSCESITDGVDSKGACIAIGGNVDVGDKLRLALCNQGADQSFEFTAADGRIRPTANSNLCLAKTSAVGPAGSNERTDFALADCLTADPLDITWTVSSSMIVEEPYADDPVESAGPPIVPSPSTTSTSAASRIPSEGPSKIVNNPPSPSPTVTQSPPETTDISETNGSIPTVNPSVTDESTSADEIIAESKNTTSSTKDNAESATAGVDDVENSSASTPLGTFVFVVAIPCMGVIAAFVN